MKFSRAFVSTTSIIFMMPTLTNNLIHTLKADFMRNTNLLIQSSPHFFAIMNVDEGTYSFQCH